MQVLWLSFSLFMGFLLEVLLGRQGLPVPVVGLVAFHFGVLRCYWKSLLWGCLFGVLVDLSYGRSSPTYVLVVPLFVLLARVWRRQQLTHLLVLQVLPGLCCGFVYAFLYGVPWLFSVPSLTWSDHLMFWLLVFRSCAGCVVLYPLLCWLLEWGAFHLGLQRYSRVGSEYLAGSYADDSAEVPDVDA